MGVGRKARLLVRLTRFLRCRVYISITCTPATRERAQRLCVGAGGAREALIKRDQATTPRGKRLKARRLVCTLVEWAADWMVGVAPLRINGWVASFRPFSPPLSPKPARGEWPRAEQSNAPRSRGVFPASSRAFSTDRADRIGCDCAPRPISFRSHLRDCCFYRQARANSARKPDGLPPDEPRSEIKLDLGWSRCRRRTSGTSRLLLGHRFTLLPRNVIACRSSAAVYCFIRWFHYVLHLFNVMFEWERFITRLTGRICPCNSYTQAHM